MKNKPIIPVLVISFVIRCILACVIELNNDEVYYWTYAQKLQWNYFDHPPGLAVLLRIFTVDLLFQQEFFLRLGSIVCAAISTWLIYLIGKKIKNESAGLIAAILFTASPYCSIIAGLLLIPDAPQLVFWLASILLMLQIIDPDISKLKQNQKLLLLGITIGCSIMCKVHWVFLCVGFFSYIVLFQRRLLRNPFLYCSGFITTIIISPIVFWNLANNFVSYRYHSERVSFFGNLQMDGFLREIAGEIGYNNPISFIILLIALIDVIKKNPFTDQPSKKLLLLVSLPMITAVLLMALFRDTLPHWTGPAYTGLIPLAAAFMASKQINISFWMPSPVKWALIFTIALLVPALVVIKWLPFNTGVRSGVI